jgi:hypothetical protein
VHRPGGQRRRRGNRLPPFVPLVWGMLNSPAYRALPYAAAKALPFFLGKFKGGFHDPGKYQEEFRFSYGEGQRYGFSSATFSKVIQDLVRLGFIDPVDRGGLKSDGKGFSLFRLSQRWEGYGTPSFEALEWRCFQPRARPNATLKSETHSFKKRNERGNGKKKFSDSEVVGGFKA